VLSAVELRECPAVGVVVEVELLLVEVNIAGNNLG